MQISDKRIKKMKFREMINIGTTTLARLGNNSPVSLDVLMRICQALDCRVEDILEFTPDKND